MEESKKIKKERDNLCKYYYSSIINHSVFIQNSKF